MALSALLGAESVAEIQWPSLLSAVDIPAVIIALVSGVAIIKFKASPILVLLAAGVLGVVLFGVLGI